MPLPLFRLFFLAASFFWGDLLDMFCFNARLLSVPAGNIGGFFYEIEKIKVPEVSGLPEFRPLLVRLFAYFEHYYTPPGLSLRGV